MTQTLTLVASDRPLTASFVATLQALCKTDGSATWLSPAKAASFEIATVPDDALWAALLRTAAADHIDLFVTPVEGQRKTLLIADMDATIVTTETLDELARFAGLYEKISAITERAMRGELDFRQALAARVALLKGLPQAALEQTLAETVLTDGAKTFVRTMAAHSATCVLVSGGFTFFTGAVAEQAGFHHHHGNILGLSDDGLTGTVDDPILDKDAKRAFLLDYCDRLGIAPDDALAIGDGANDLPMLQTAGLGIGFHPKPLVEASIRNCIRYGDLTTALYAQGYHDDELVTRP